MKSINVTACVQLRVNVRLHLQASTYELIELHTQPTMTSTDSSLRCRHLLTPDDNQQLLLSPAAAAAAAADTSLTHINSKRQSQLELIKKAKHNRGKITFSLRPRNLNVLVS